MRFIQLDDRYINIDQITHITPNRDAYNEPLPGIAIHFAATDGCESHCHQTTLYLNDDEATRFLAELRQAAAVYVA